MITPPAHDDMAPMLEAASGEDGDAAHSDCSRAAPASGIVSLGGRLCVRSTLEKPIRMKARAAAVLSVSAATMLSGAKVVEQALQETPLDLEWPLPGIAPWLPHDSPVAMA